jgi:hypothetical protein
VTQTALLDADDAPIGSGRDGCARAAEEYGLRL